MSDEIAISVKKVSKSFRLPHNKKSTIKSVIVSPFSKTTYEKQHALVDVSFDVAKGEFFGIIGRNGSGKSTLLKMLAGIYSPDKGSIEVNGRLTPFIELGVGFNPDLTGRENVFLNGSLLGFNRKEMQAMYKDIVEFAELEKFMDQKLKNYSSGMQVRLAFSIAIRSNSDILLLDEVLAVGDMNFQKKCFNYFKSLKEQKKTVIFVSHDMNAVKEYCDNGILINDSKLVPTKDFGEVISKYIKIMNPKQQVAETKPKLISNQIEVIGKDIKVGKDEIVFKVKIKFYEYLNQNYYMAFSIKNEIEQKVLGTNTEVFQKDMVPSAKKDHFEVVWKMPNILSRSEYSINISVFNHSKTQLATFEDVLSFSNDEKNANYFSVNPVTEIEIL